MATVPVKYLHSGMAGAPVLSGTAGAMIAVLDAGLKDGFGLKTVDSLVVASNVATMTISTGHSAESGSVVTVAGATPSTLNGEWRVTATTTNTIQFATSGISDQTATGTITTKMAPLGWNKPYSGTNVGVYRSAEPASLGHYLRVDDTGTTEARVRGYEAMTTVDNGTGPFPLDTQIGGGGYWAKSSAANSTAHNWVLIGDGMFFWLWVVPFDSTSVTSQGMFFWFGDAIPTSSTDFFHTCLGCRTSGTSYGYMPFYTWDSNGYHLLFSPRSYTGVGSSASLKSTAESHLMQSGQASGGSNGGYALPYPHGTDNGLYMSRILTMEGGFSSSPTIRAALPGAYYLPQNIGFALGSKDTIDGQNDVTGRRLMALRYGIGGGGQNGTGGIWGVGIFDITGPWR